MCVLSAGGRAAIFLKNFILSNGVFESKRICSCLWGITFYWFPIPKLDLVRFQKLKTSNKNNYNITAYATKKKKSNANRSPPSFILCILVQSMRWAGSCVGSPHNLVLQSWPLGRGGLLVHRRSWAWVVASTVTGEVILRVLSCPAKLGGDVCNL